LLEFLVLLELIELSGLILLEGQEAGKAEARGRRSEVRGQKTGEIRIEVEKMRS